MSAVVADPRDVYIERVGQAWLKATKGDWHEYSAFVERYNHKYV